MKEEEEDLTDPEDAPMKEGGEITTAGSNERTNDGKTAIFKENDTVAIPTIFPLSSLTRVVFLSLILWENSKLRELHVI